MATTSRRRRATFVAVVTAAVAVVIVTVLAVSSGHRQAVTPAAGGVLAESACGLRGSAGTGAEGAIAATWAPVGAYMLPISGTDGPGVRVDSGPWSCFTRSQSGAVLAGLVIPWLASGAAENWQDVVRTQTMPGPGQAAKLERGLGNAEVVTVRGFDVAAYSQDRATVRYYLHTPTIDATCSEELAWSEGDWRLVLGDDGSTSSGCTRGAPENFTPWGP